MIAAPAAPAAIVIPSTIAFWDSRHGLVGTETCVGDVTPCRSGAIEVTSDGGRSFRIVLRTRRPVVKLQTAGPDGAIAETDSGGSFRTLDGGRSWQRFALRHGASFATARIALGFHSYLTRGHLAMTLLTTRDGGRTWRSRASPCPQAVSFDALVDLVTPSLGWLICLGQPSAGQELKAVFRTSDGGRSWSRRASNRRSSLGGYGYPQGVAFAPDGFGILWESRGTLFVTRDGGAHWLAKTKVAIPEIDFGRGAAAFRNGRGLILIGRDGAGRPARLLVTGDAGRSWRLIHRW